MTEIRKGILIYDAFQELGLGIKNTFERHKNKLEALLLNLESSSLVFQEFLDQLSTSQLESPIKLYLGKNSCQFIDSAEDWTMDMDDLEHFEISNSNDGISQLEILIHILEERWMMKQPGKNYISSHLCCLSLNSFQNR
jgi:hypothetical protein